MKQTHTVTISTIATAFILLCSPLTTRAGEALLLWPNGAPGERGNIPAEKTETTQGKAPIEKVTNVTAPTLTFYPAPNPNKTKTTVIVFPGGGYNILANDLEGTEIIDWLNSIGVNAVLLKYRVPRRPGLAKHTAALQDSQRAVGMVRHRADRWGLDPERIGVLGFSAGGHLTAMTSNHYEARSYHRVDASDDISSRPDFAILIYPAYLTHPDDILRLTDDLTVTKNTPPSFIIMTQDDGVKVESSLVYYLALKRAQVPVEMHLYPSGGHGYGLRASEHLVSSWPERCADWLKASKLLQ